MHTNTEKTFKTSLIGAGEFSVKGVFLAGLCLVTLTVPVNGAPGFAPEATSSLSRVELTEQFDEVQGQLDESASVNPGGGIYSPFSTISDASTAQRTETSAKAVQGRDRGLEEAPDLVATTLAAGIAAGLLAYLVRVLLTI